MHTLIVIGVGLLLLGVCLLAGSAAAGAPGIARAALLFLPLWFLGAGINLWIGVRSAGYGVGEELPVFFVVFALPALVAMLTWWRVH